MLRTLVAGTGVNLAVAFLLGYPVVLLVHCMMDEEEMKGKNSMMAMNNSIYIGWRFMDAQ